MTMFDFHIHTKYSSCSSKHGEYSLIDAYNVAIERGFAGIGVSDHCNYKGYKKPNQFLAIQRNKIDELNLSDSLLLGLEISIINKKGSLGVNPKYLKRLDYYIVSEHAHLSKPFSEFFRLKGKFVKWMQVGNEAKINSTVDYLTEMTVNALNRNTGMIFAHIWRFTRHRGCFTPYTLTKTEFILEALQRNGIAFELHNGLISSLLLTKEEDEIQHQKILSGVSNKIRDSILSPKKYVEEIFSLLKKYDLHYSIGSDAHIVSQVGRLGKFTSAQELMKFLNSIGIPENRIIGPDFFKN